MSRNIMNISKWLPLETDDTKTLSFKCKNLRTEAELLILKLADFINNLKTTGLLNLEEVEILSEEIHKVVEQYRTTTFKMDAQPPLKCFKLRAIVNMLWKSKLKLKYLLQQLIADLLTHFGKDGDKLLDFALRLSNDYNDCLALGHKYSSSKKAALCVNSCPQLLYPMRKISITKILQVLAQHRAEACCHSLIDCLLDNYKLYEIKDNGDSALDSNSDNSSVEIYKALTGHMTPPLEPRPTTAKGDAATRTNSESEGEDDSLEALELLIAHEQKQVTALLNAAMTVSPKMLGPDGVKKIKATGETRVNQKAVTKAMEYYQQLLWGEVGNYLEHVVLWWGAAPMASRPPHSSQHLREWILQFTSTARVPQEILAALHSLADALGCHVTSTSWDDHFRLALVSAYVGGDAATGRLFADTLQDLVRLSNQCEVTHEWIVGAPLDELPLVEQIPVLHRLDHSVHTTRLWAAAETRKLANGWHVDAFFAVTQTDIAQCLSQLDGVRLADRSADIEKGGLAVHVQVCAKMREKLVSEVRANVDKLKLQTKECIDVLARICRTVCLANLQMVFPEPKYWRKMDQEQPKLPSPYVTVYLDRVLLPVLEATDDHAISNMVLRIMCECWLDHIYANRIKFTGRGALQLLVDFGSVADWLVGCPIVTRDVRKHMLRNEVLRRCEGVGRLLLRSPGDPIHMAANAAKRVSEEDEAGGSPGSAAPEMMPAEMYVPNQEQWLELRAVKKKSLFLTSLCCSTGLDS